jgi:hypothetical protein
VGDIEAMPRHHVEKSRHWLKQVLVGVRMIPNSAKGLIAEVEIHGAGLLRLAAGTSTIDLVAGVRFEAFPTDIHLRR